jgi:hypothetical protein
VRGTVTVTDDVTIAMKAFRRHRRDCGYQQNTRSVISLSSSTSSHLLRDSDSILCAVTDLKDEEHTECEGDGRKKSAHLP